MQKSIKNPLKRETYQKKKASKGVKSFRGKPEYYDELKERVSICITKTARHGLDEMSKKMGISRSELIERIGRGDLQVTYPEDPAII